MTFMQCFFWIVAIGGNIACYFLTQFAPWGVWIWALIMVYTIIGLHDLWFSNHNLNRLYPVVAYCRYMLEFIRPEIQQYFIASNISERPFNREQRSLVYRRAKQLDDTMPFGTEMDIRAPGFFFARHSLDPKVVSDEHSRVVFGGESCKKPYSASRLNISAMSFGALSDRAIRSLNRGAKLGGFAHNTGEGGLSPYHLAEKGDIFWQIGTGYFGCRAKNGRFDPEQFKDKSQNDVVKMIEIKLSQGAKPSHGGVLPGSKVDAEIAEMRGVEVGKDCISPPTHAEFSNPTGLLEFVEKLRDLSQGKPIGFKLCVGEIAELAAIVKAMKETGMMPDFITIDGAEGGTGAAPLEFSNRLGAPCLEATYSLHNLLRATNLRDKLRIISSGKTATGFDMVTKIALGANTVNAARTMMMAVGCIQSQSCNTNRCPTGIATQDKTRSKAIDIGAKSLRVKNFHDNTIKNCFNLIGAMGYDNPDELEPRNIFRRTPDEKALHFDEIYTPLPDGCLVDGDTSNQYYQWFQKISIDRFKQDVYV